MSSAGYVSTWGGSFATHWVMGDPSWRRVMLDPEGRAA